MPFDRTDRAAGPKTRMKKLRQDPDTDEDFLARYRDGDAEAFRQLVDYFQDRMLQFFYRLCWDRSRAEDLTQDLFLKLMQGSRRYRARGRLSYFVYRVATNLWIDHYRAARPQPRLYSIDHAAVGDHDGSVRQQIPGDDPSPMEVLAGEEEKLALRKALESLTEPHRIVFELAVYEERPYAEISELLDIPVGTIKSRMHNAVAALKRVMDTGEQSDAAGERGRRRAGDGGST